MSSVLRNALLLVFFSATLAGCVTYIPVDEYNLARTAYQAALSSEAAQYAPSLWFNAEQAYREGQKAYNDRRYEDARYQFSQARTFAEQAERAARLARQQSGDIIPQ